MSITEFVVLMGVSTNANVLVPTAEWICRQSEFCSYAPSTLVGSLALSEFADYNDYNENLASVAGVNRIVLDDGSAIYGQPVCPVSRCEAVLFRDSYARGRAATCPVGTEMKLSLVGPTGLHQYIFSPGSGVELSGSLPDICNLIGGKYVCAGGPITLKFAYNSAPCQPFLDNCQFPETGRAFGQCGANGGCVRNMAAADVKPPTTPICFSGENTVEHMDKGEISINKLVIGDMIKANKDTFDRVYGFGHRDETTKGEYIQIHAIGLTHPLELSKDHMLFVQNDYVEQSIPASLVKTGDKLIMGSGPVAEVQDTNTVTRRGAYAPLTTSGTVVVNGVMASTYVSLQDDSGVLVIGGIKTVSMQWLAHLSQAPHRIVCALNWSFCQDETYMNNGISKWVDGPLRISTWLLEQNPVVVTVVVVPVFGALALLALVEKFFMSPLPLR